ncbi:hypothetical protein Tco_0641267 [Tanacetum coccineum]
MHSRQVRMKDLKDKEKIKIKITGIASVAIIDRHLPFEYTITSRSTDVMVPISPVPASDSAANVLAEWNVVYDAQNEVACLMLGSMTLELHRQFETYSPYEILQELKSMFEKQAGVECLLDAVGITAAYVCVNAAQSKLVLLMNFKENILSFYYCLYTVSAASTKLPLLRD